MSGATPQGELVLILISPHSFHGLGAEVLAISAPVITTRFLAL